MRDFRGLKVWENGHRLALNTYEITGSFSKSELYGLTSRLRRCAASVPANIAEGCGADGDAEFARFLEISMRSASELDYHLLLAHDLRLIDAERYRALFEQVTLVKKMLISLIRKLRPHRRQT